MSFSRNFSSCSYFFAIPLPFSISSLSYCNGFFYAIRDEFVDGSSTLYRISDTDLIGGYVYWLRMNEMQCQSCSPEERPSFFDLNNWQEACTT